MNEINPRLILIAGPNGSGKTEFTKRALAHEWLEGCEYINPDQIAQDKFGDWNSPTAVAEAAKFATNLRYECIASGKSMALETVFSSDEKLEFVKKAINANFFIRIFFIGTDSPSINTSRIASRVLTGGHDVPIPKIISRYRKSILNLIKVIPLIDRGYVFDNSVEGSLPKLQFRTVSGAIERIYSDEHSWAIQVRSRF